MSIMRKRFCPNWRLYMKIAIIGYSGSGKSTLAKKLSEFYNCPLLYLDTVQFESGWKVRDINKGCLIVEEFM